MKIIKILFLLILGSSAYAQELTAEHVTELPLRAQKFVGTDEFGSLYYVNDNILYKKTSGKLFSYSNVELGKLRDVNIRNPFKIILFYADFNAVIILDNNLNELTQRIDFTKGTLFNNVQFVTGASQNNIWLYADDNKLHLYDWEGLRELLQTQAMTFHEPDFVPKNLVSTYKKVWVLSQNTVFEFNEYGVYNKRYDLENADDIFPFQKGFLYLTKGSFFYQQENVRLPVKLNHQKSIESVYVNNSNIFIYDGAVVYQYQLLH